MDHLFVCSLQQVRVLCHACLLCALGFKEGQRLVAIPVFSLYSLIFISIACFCCDCSHCSFSYNCYCYYYCYIVTLTSRNSGVNLSTEVAQSIVYLFSIIGGKLTIDQAILEKYIIIFIIFLWKSILLIQTWSFSNTYFRRSFCCWWNSARLVGYIRCVGRQ